MALGRSAIEKQDRRSGFENDDWRRRGNLQEDITLRQMLPTDGPAISRLNSETPDTGAVAIFTKYRRDPYETLLAMRPTMVGVVAEASGREGIVGMGLVTFGECQYEGELRPYAYLSSLGVHPDYRRRGIASKLAQWRVELARERFREVGQEGIIFAAVQGGNTGSFQTAGKWSNHRIDGHDRVAVAKTRRRPPKSMPALIVRKAEASEFEEIAARQNEFYREYNLYTPESAESLDTWQSMRPFNIHLSDYYVAVKGQGSIVAGLGVEALGELMTDHIVRMPLPLRVANVFLRMIPRDGVNRRLRVSRFWFAPGEVESGMYLWESVRWLLRERGTILMTFYDANGPLQSAIPLPWFMPPQRGSLVLSAPTPPAPARLLYFQL